MKAESHYPAENLKELIHEKGQMSSFQCKMHAVVVVVVVVVIVIYIHRNVHYEFIQRVTL